MAFTFNLERADGTAAEPPTLKTVAWSCEQATRSPLSYKTLRVIDVLGDVVDCD
jgi:hypothetical protein